MRSLLKSAVIMLLSGGIISGAEPNPTPPPGGLEYVSRYALYAPAPIYPGAARHNRSGGDGIYALSVRPNGTVSKVRVLRTTGSGLLDQAAIAALRRWRFVPGKFTLVAVPMTFAVKNR